MQNRFKRRTPLETHPKFFYFNVADESHAKILQQTRKVDPMQSLGRMMEIDEY